MIISDYNISNAQHKIPNEFDYSNSINTSTDEKNVVKREKKMAHIHPHAYVTTLTFIQFVESLAHSIELRKPF